MVLRPVHIWSIDLQAPEEAVQRARACLSPDERERADAYRFRDSARTYTLTRAVLRSLLARELDSLPERIEFRYEENGKPFLKDPSLPIRFNVTHSGGIAGCAISFATDVGLDIEQLRPKPDLLQLATRFFHPSEFKWIASLPVTVQQQEFYRTWVRKEAYIKATGGSIFASVNNALPASGWRVHEFAPSAGYVGALAVRTESPLQVVRHPLVNASLLVP